MEPIANILHFYETTKAFNDHKDRGLISPDSICFIKEDGLIYTQNNYFGLGGKLVEDLTNLVHEYGETLKIYGDTLDNISGVKGPSTEDNLINNLADITKFLQGFSTQENLKNYITKVKDTIQNDVDSRLNAVDNSISSINTELDNIDIRLDNHTDEINALDEAKVDKVAGKGLSTNDFTNALRDKLESLSNYNDTELRTKIDGLISSFETLLNSNPTQAIENFNEIIKFLENIEDTQSLSAIIASIEQQIADAEKKIQANTEAIENIDFTPYVKFTDLATTEKSGAMSALDKQYLEAEYGNTVTNIVGVRRYNDMAYLEFDQKTLTSDSVIVNHKISLNLPLASKNYVGLMHSIDKTKLDDIEENATADRALTEDEINEICV